MIIYIPPHLVLFTRIYDPNLTIEQKTFYSLDFFTSYFAMCYLMFVHLNNFYAVIYRLVATGVRRFCCISHIALILLSLMYTQKKHLNAISLVWI